MSSESSAAARTDAGLHSEVPGHKTRKRTSPEDATAAAEPYNKAMRWSSPEASAGSPAQARGAVTEPELSKWPAAHAETNASTRQPAVSRASDITSFLRTSHVDGTQPLVPADTQPRPHPTEQHTIAACLQPSLLASSNPGVQSVQEAADPTNLALLLQLADQTAQSAQSVQSAPQPHVSQPRPLQSTGSVSQPKDEQQQHQQQQQDSLLSQLQLLLQLQQHLQQQQQRQQQPAGQQLLHQQLLQLHQQTESGEEGSEAMDPAVREASALLHQQLEQVAKEQHDAGIKAQEGGICQPLNLQRVPPPLQLELPTQRSSASGVPPSASQVLPAPLLLPTQQLVQMLLALQAAHPPAADTAQSSHVQPQEAQAHQAMEGGREVGQEGGEDASRGAPKAKAGAAALLASGPTEAQLLQLLERVGMQHSVEGRALLRAASIQLSASASGPALGSTGQQAGDRAPDDAAQPALATQQAAAALAAASAVAADAAVAAAAGPHASLPPVSLLTRIHQPGGVPKRPRTRKQGPKGLHGGTCDDCDTVNIMEDYPAATDEDLLQTPSSVAPPQSSAPFAELRVQGGSALPVVAAPSISPSSMLSALAPSGPDAAPAHGLHAGHIASGTSTSVDAAAAASMAAALDQSVLPLLQQIAPLGVQQLTPEQREQAERMLLQLLPLLPLATSDGPHPELEVEAATTQDSGLRLMPSTSGAVPYGSLCDGSRTIMALPAQHIAAGAAAPSPAGLSTIISGRGRRDQGPKRLLDFRLHVPHKFVETHFPEQVFPLHTVADVYVNSEAVREAAPVKLYSTRNNTRKTGIGNFWLTGLQQTIKLYKDVKVNSISVADAGEGQVKKFVLHLMAQGVWHEPPAFVKRGLGQTGDTTGNPAVKPYDGRIHVPLALMKQNFAAVEDFPMLTSADMYLNGELMAEGVGVRVVRYQKHKREGHYNYWITGHQKLVRSCNDLRVLCVEFLPEGRFKICFVAPQ